MPDLYWLAPLLTHLFVAVLFVVPVFFLGRWYEREAGRELWKETRRGVEFVVPFAQEGLGEVKLADTWRPECHWCDQRVRAWRSTTPKRAEETRRRG